MGLAYAQEVDAYETDPPERAARLGYISGDVSLQPAGEEAWAPALLNRPLTTATTCGQNQAPAPKFRLARLTSGWTATPGFSFLEVDNYVVRMRITTGVMNVGVHSLAGSERIEIDTPDVTVSLLRSGSYRIEVDDAGDSYGRQGRRWRRGGYGTCAKRRRACPAKRQVQRCR